MLSFFSFLVLLLAAFTGLYWLWRKRIDAEIAEGAAIEWEHLQKHEPDLLEGFDEARFAAIYKHVNEPRFPGYVLATFATFIAALPAILIALTALLWAAAELGAVPEPMDVATQLNLEGGEITVLGKSIDEETRYQAALYYIRDLGGFYYFFGVLLSWLGIVAFYMRRFHARRPGYLRDELLRART